MSPPRDPALLAAQRRVATDLVDKISGDADFRARFQDNPEEALRDAGVLDEISALNDEHRETRPSPEDENMEWSVACCVSVVY